MERRRNRPRLHRVRTRLHVKAAAPTLAGPEHHPDRPATPPHDPTSRGTAPAAPKAASSTRSRSRNSRTPTTRQHLAQLRNPRPHRRPIRATPVRPHPGNVHPGQARRQAVITEHRRQHRHGQAMRRRSRPDLLIEPRHGFLPPPLRILHRAGGLLDRPHGPQFQFLPPPQRPRRLIPRSARHCPTVTTAESARQTTPHTNYRTVRT